jgi:hypothetical protein
MLIVLLLVILLYVSSFLEYYYGWASSFPIFVAYIIYLGSFFIFLIVFMLTCALLLKTDNRSSSLRLVAVYSGALVAGILLSFFLYYPSQNLGAGWARALKKKPRKKIATEMLNIAKRDHYENGSAVRLKKCYKYLSEGGRVYYYYKNALASIVFIEPSGLESLPQALLYTNASQASRYEVMQQEYIYGFEFQPDTEHWWLGY